MKVLIIEDEKPAVDRLRRLLSEADNKIEIMQVLESVESSVNWLSNNPPPDLIFMDIQLDDGTCFEIFEAVRIEVPVIFVTAYNEYAIRAFKVNSIDYLLKPTDLPSLKTALNKYRKLYRGTIEGHDKIMSIYEQLVKNYKTRFFIKTGTHFKSIQATDIECFFISERSVFLRTLAGRSYDLDYSLDQIEKLVDPGMFFRINRNHLVNIHAVTDILIYSTSRLRLRLKNDQENEALIVSREKVNEFRKWMDR